MNGFLPLTLLKKYLFYDKDFIITKKGIVEYVEANFDFERLSSAVNIPNLFNQISMKSYLKNQSSIEDRHIEYYIHFTSFKICPICIKDWRIPISHLLQDVSICLLHKTRLVAYCTCGRRIKLQNLRGNMLCSSKKCNKPLYELTKTVDDITLLERTKQSYSFYKIYDFSYKE
jgi:hypothetical protein